MFERRKSRRGLKILGLILATTLLTGLFLFIGIPNFIISQQKPLKNQIGFLGNSNNVGSPIGVTDGGSTIVTQVSNSVMSSVVGISGLVLDKAKIFDSGGAGKWGIGSGIIVSQNGYIITNNHVAGGKAKIVVTLSDGKVVDGKTIWADPVLDLAVVKIDGNGFPVATLGDSNTLKVGDVAVAIGNPLGLQFQRTVTSGIISGLNRTISVDTSTGPNYMEDLIQTDALINPGNSGGPLLNSKGEVIGINSLKIQTAEGMGFAIPINIVKPIVRDFVQKGVHVSPHIGIFAYDKNVINYIDNSANLNKGLYVADVDQNSPASRAGIKVGDVITQIDNSEIDTMMDFRTYMYNKGIGASVNISYYSNGKPQTAVVTLEPSPKSDVTR